MSDLNPTTPPAGQAPPEPAAPDDSYVPAPPEPGTPGTPAPVIQTQSGEDAPTGVQLPENSELFKAMERRHAADDPADGSPPVPPVPDAPGGVGVGEGEPGALAPPGSPDPVVPPAAPQPGDPMDKGTSAGIDPAFGLPVPPPPGTQPDPGAAAGAPDPTAPPAPGGPPPTQPVDEPVVWAGQTFEPTDMQRIVQQDNLLRSLPPETIQGIDAYIGGQAALIPAQEAQQFMEWKRAGSPPVQPQYTPPPQQYAPAAPVTPPGVQPGYPPPVPPGQPYQQPYPGQAPVAYQSMDPTLPDYLPPAAAQQLAQVQQELARVQQQEQANAQQQLQQERMQLQAGIQAATSTFGQTQGLTPMEVDGLVQQAVQLGVLPALQQKHNGNAEAAMAEALEAAYWQNPIYRQRELDRRAGTLQTDQEIAATRQGKLASLSGNGGGTPPPQAPPPSPTGDPRRDGMTAAIAQAMGR